MNLTHQVTPGLTSQHVNTVSKNIVSTAQKFMQDSQEAFDAEAGQKDSSDRKAAITDGPVSELALDTLLQLEIDKSQVEGRAMPISETVLARDLIRSKILGYSR